MNRTRESLLGYGFLIPSLAVLGTFSLYPIGLAIWMSLHKCGFDGARETFLGLANYAEAFGDAEFWSALKVTVFYALGTIPATLVLSFVIANLLFMKIRGRGFYRSVYFLPFVTSAVAAAAVWKWVYHPQVEDAFGIANVVLNTIGLEGQKWLLEPRGVLTIVFGGMIPSWAAGPSLALCCVMVNSVWHALGFSVVIFLAGLSNVPTEMYDAAKIDGAGFWRTMWSVTFPMVSPTFYFLVMVSTIGAFQTFTPIYVMTAGGPAGTTTNMTMLIFDKFYTSHGTTGYAAALAIVLFGIILVLTSLQARFAGKRVHYA